MWRATLAFCLALILGVPALCHAQYENLDQQSDDYTDEDSQPLKLISYVLAPVGFALEWGVARPMHYLATKSPAAPVLGANIANDSNGLPAGVHPLPPPDSIEESAPVASEAEIIPGRVPGSSSASTSQTTSPAIAVGGQSSGARTEGTMAPATTNQPAIH